MGHIGKIPIHIFTILQKIFVSRMYQKILFDYISRVEERKIMKHGIAILVSALESVNK